MLKLQEGGLFTASLAKDSHFAGILLGTHNENNGVNFLRKVRLVSMVTIPAADETIVVGANTYTFKVTPTLVTEIAIGASKAACTANIIAKINADKATCACSAYSVQSLEKLLLVATVSGASPTLTVDGVKIVATTGWVSTLANSFLISEDVYKIPLTDVNAKPIALVERNAGTYQNFLY